MKAIEDSPANDDTAASDSGKPAAQPLKDRRKIAGRVAIVAAMVVLVAGLFFRPRHDPRLVGRWVRRSTGGVVTRFELGADGTGTLVTSHLKTFPLRWWTSRGRLVIHYTGQSALHSFHELLHEAYCSIRGVQSNGLIEQLPIVRVEPDEIQFDASFWLREAKDR